jgi:pectate lyase
MPSVRFGRAHVFNNYFTATGNNYCTRSRLNAEVLAENNHYEAVQNPFEVIITTGTTGLLRATGNITNNCTFNTTYPHNTGGTLVLADGTDVLTAGDPLGLNPPPYTYTPDDAANVASLIQQHAGAGKGPFAP